MAKKTGISIVKPTFEGLNASQDFDQIRTRTQVGDKFYVPEAEDLLVLKTSINAVDARGNAQLDNDGNPILRNVAQRFCAVRLIDNKPDSIVELYVGQVVKIDVHGQVVFPNELSNALRTSGEAFKNAICGKTLEVVEQKPCADRVWLERESRWKRNEDNTLASQEKLASHFEPKATAMSAADVKAATELLYKYYNEKYAEYVA